MLFIQNKKILAAIVLSFLMSIAISAFGVEAPPCETQWLMPQIVRPEAMTAKKTEELRKYATEKRQEATVAVLEWLKTEKYRLLGNGYLFKNDIAELWDADELHDHLHKIADLDTYYSAPWSIAEIAGFLLSPIFSTMATTKTRIEKRRERDLFIQINNPEIVTLIKRLRDIVIAHDQERRFHPVTEFMSLIIIELDLYRELLFTNEEVTGNILHVSKSIQSFGIIMNAFFDALPEH